MPDQNREDADALRLQMASVRSTLDGNVDELVTNVNDLVTNARQLTDWRYYVKAAPWASVGAAAAVGYMLVPRRVQVVRPSADQLEELATRHPFGLGPAAQAEAKRGGPTQAVMTMVANALLRAVTAYVSQQAGKAFGQQAAEKSQDPFNAEVPRP